MSIAVAALSTLLLPAGAFAQPAKSTYPSLLSGAQIKGAEVSNLQNEEIGSIDELLVDPSSGRIRFAILSVGGFLGIGDTEVAVPWDAFRVAKQGDAPKYTLDASKDRLEKAPRVEGKRYDRLYTRPDAEPTFIYWGITWYDLGPFSHLGASPSPQGTPSPSPQKK